MTELLGLEFFDGSPDEAVEQALRLIERGCAYAVTPNPEIVLAARKNPALLRVIRGADLVLPDGVGLILAARIVRSSLRSRIPGIDFASALMARLAERQGSVFLLGAVPGVAEDANRRLCRQYPGLRVVGARHGYFTEREEQETLDEIGRAEPDLLLVCLGSPRQELWIAEHARRLPVGLMIGLGGALDVYAGRKRRAPAFLRSVGLEWLYRLLREPGRIKRMIRLPGILWAARRERDRRKT